MREILRFLIGFVLLISFDIGAYATPYQSGGMSSGGAGTGSTSCSIRTGTPPVADEVLLVKNAGGYLECEKGSCSGKFVAVLGEVCINTKNKKCKSDGLYMCSLGVNDSWVDKGAIKQCSGGKSDTGNMHKVLLDKNNKKYENYATTYSLSDLQKVCWTWDCNSGFKFDSNTKKCVSNAQSSAISKEEAAQSKPKNKVAKPQTEQPVEEQSVKSNGAEGEKIGQPCTSQYAKKAVWQKIDKEIKCVAKECNPDRYLVVNSKGESQGYCIANTCKAPKTLNIIDGTKTDKRCVDPAASEIAEETIEEDVEEELPTVPFRPDLQVKLGGGCDTQILNKFHAGSGTYTKNSDGTLTCRLLTCDSNYVLMDTDATPYNIANIQLVMTEKCEYCDPDENEIISGRCVEKKKYNIGEQCADDLLDGLNAISGVYKKYAYDDIYCDITECKDGFVIRMDKNGSRISTGTNTIYKQRMFCELCDSTTHEINAKGECVKKTDNGPATDGTPAEANVSITVQGTINDSAGNCLANAEIVFPDGAYINQDGCNFTVGLQTSGEITFSAQGYESVTNTYNASANNVQIVLTKSATDENNNEEVVSPETPVEDDEQEEVDEDDKIQELRDKADAAHERENSMANKMLGAAGIGATGIGGMMLMQGLSEQKADDNAEEQMAAYLSTFMCRYGDGRAKGGESDIELPGANALLPLYSEYVTLANETKAMKTELDLKPGIESESILDNAASGLYDDENSGKTSGAFASLARALQNPDGEDAKKWAEQTEKTSKNVKTGAITAGAGAVGGLVGHIAESTAYKKKAEKGEDDSDDKSKDKKYKPKIGTKR